VGVRGGLWPYPKARRERARGRTPPLKKRGTVKRFGVEPSDAHIRRSQSRSKALACPGLALPLTSARSVFRRSRTAVSYGILGISYTDHLTA